VAVKDRDSSKGLFVTVVDGRLNFPLEDSGTLVQQDFTFSVNDFRLEFHSDARG